MKLFTNQCPFCLRTVRTGIYHQVYPCASICCFCGALFISINGSHHREMTRQELMDFKKQYPMLPTVIQQIHDRAVVGQWG